MGLQTCHPKNGAVKTGCIAALAGYDKNDARASCVPRSNRIVKVHFRSNSRWRTMPEVLKV